MRPVHVWPHARIASAMALCSVLSGCYYYAPYGYVPYENAAAEPSEFAFTLPAGTSGESTASEAFVTTGTYVPTTTTVFTAPRYYTRAYPYYAWPARWQQSVSVGFAIGAVAVTAEADTATGVTAAIVATEAMADTTEATGDIDTVAGGMAMAAGVDAGAGIPGCAVAATDDRDKPL